MTNVLLQTGLCSKATSASVGQRPIAQVLGAADIKLSTNVANTIVEASDVSLKVGLFAEHLATAIAGADHRLTDLLKVAGVLNLCMCFHGVSSGKDLVTESTTDVSLLHVVLELLHGGKADAIRGGIAETLVALFAPKLDIRMLLLDMAPQGRGRVKASVTTFVLALESRHLEMLGTNVALQSLVLAEGLIARREISAAEAFLSFMDKLMAAKAGARQEALVAAGLLAYVLSLGGVRSPKMLLQMLLLQVRLVTPIVRALEGALIGVGSQMSSQTSWTIKCLFAAGPCTLDGLEIGRELLAWRRGRRRSHGSSDGIGCRGIVELIVVLVGKVRVPSIVDLIKFGIDV